MHFDQTYMPKQTSLILFYIKKKILFSNILSISFDKKLVICSWKFLHSNSNVYLEFRKKTTLYFLHHIKQVWNNCYGVRFRILCLIWKKKKHFPQHFWWFYPSLQHTFSSYTLAWNFSWLSCWHLNTAKLQLDDHSTLNAYLLKAAQQKC